LAYLKELQGVNQPPVAKVLSNLKFPPIKEVLMKRIIHNDRPTAYVKELRGVRIPCSKVLSNLKFPQSRRSS
jgi:hypothetical protein